MAAAGAAPCKPDDGREQKILSAVADKRLTGQEEEVYYLLRGLGMTTVPNEFPPRIEILAAGQPALFAAMRRLGFRPQGGRIRVEAKPAAAAASGGTLGLEAAGVLALHEGPPEECSFVSSKLARTLGKPFAAPAPVRPPPDRKSAEANFLRLQRPKTAQSKSALIASMQHAKVEEWPRPPKPKNDPSAPRIPLRTSDVKVSELYYVDRVDVPDWWQKAPLGVPLGRTACEQQLLCSALSKPRARRTTPPRRTLASDFRSPSLPSQLGVTAHRSLCDRLGKINAGGGFPWVVAAHAAHAAHAHSRSGSWTMEFD